MLPTTPTRTDSRANNRVVDSVPARGRVCAHLFYFFSKCFAWNLALIPGWSTARRAQGMSYDHTTVIIPHPIRTAKSSTVGPNQYCGGGPRGNLGCRRAGFNFFFLEIFIFTKLGIFQSFSFYRRDFEHLLISVSQNSRPIRGDTESGAARARPRPMSNIPSRPFG